MNPYDTPGGGWMWHWLIEISKWLHPAIYVIGLAIAVCAFLRSRKCGYLVIAIYFALAVFWLLAAMPIWKSIWAHQPSDVSEQTRQKIELAERQATDKVLQEQGHPSMAVTKLYFPFGPIILVTGVWLLARREKPVP